MVTETLLLQQNVASFPIYKSKQTFDDTLSKVENRNFCFKYIKLLFIEF